MFDIHEWYLIRISRKIQLDSFSKDFQKIMSIFTNFKDIKFLIAKSCGNDYKRLKMKFWPNIALRSPKYLYTNTSNNTLKVRNVLE